MLVLKATEREFIRIGENIRLAVWRSEGAIKVGIEAPPHIQIARVPVGVCPYSKALENTVWMDRELDKSMGVHQ